MKASCKDCEYFNRDNPLPDLIHFGKYFGKCSFKKSIYCMFDIYISNDNICSFYKRKEENND